MMLRYFYIGTLAVVTLVLVYGNKPLAGVLLGAQSRVLDALAMRFPGMGSVQWTAATLSRPLIGALLYGIAVVSLVGAIMIYQLPPPPIHH